MTARANTQPVIQPMPTNPLVLADEEIEAALLGGLILDSDPQHVAFKRVMHLSPAHFANPRHKKIYAALHNLYERQIVFDRQTVLSALKAMGNVSEAGEEYLTSLVMLAGDNTSYYARILQQTEWLRDAEAQVLALLNTVRDRRISGTNKARKLNETAVDLMRKSSMVFGAPSHLLSVMAEEFSDAYAEAPELEIGLSTGYAQWDHATRGFKKGNAYGVAGRPGDGKSILGENLMMNLMRGGKHTLIISLEMDEREYFDRALCIESQIEDEAIKRKTFKEGQAARFIETVERFTTTYAGARQMHIKYMDQPTLSDIKSTITELHYQYGLDAVMIDYLDGRFVTPDKPGQDDLKTLGAFSRMLSNLARELHIIVIEMLQTTRESEKRGGEPLMSDVYGASAIEKDLYFLGILKIDTPYSLALGHGKTNMHIVKSRSGGKGQIVEFESRYSVFTFASWEGN